MTAKAEAQMTEKEIEKAALKAREAEIAAKETELNASRSGKGTRATIGLTRGRNPQMVQYESFWESLPDTLPVSLSEFMDLSKVQDEKVIVSFLIDGFNSSSYTNASDPVAEYVDAAWPEEIQKVFKNVVKGYAANAGVSIEETVAMLKPGFVAGLEKQGKLAKSETVGV